eukprot:scaffold4924_cov21-Cyclotella_meneghiniana.AAC.1
MAPIIQRHHPMASFDGSHHMMASIIHPSLDCIIRLHHPMASSDGIIRWLSSYDGFYHSPISRWHYSMVPIMRWLCFHHLMAFII